MNKRIRQIIVLLLSENRALLRVLGFRHRGEPSGPMRAALHFRKSRPSSSRHTDDLSIIWRIPHLPDMSDATIRRKGWRSTDWGLLSCSTQGLARTATRLSLGRNLGTLSPAGNRFFKACSCSSGRQSVKSKLSGHAHGPATMQPQPCPRQPAGGDSLLYDAYSEREITAITLRPR